MQQPQIPEPWLRGTLTDVSPVQRAILHALELAKEDLEKWCGDLTDQELNASPGGVQSVSFHIHHIDGSIDRLLTYAEGRALTPEQLGAVKEESGYQGKTQDILAELTRAIESAALRVRAFASENLSEARIVGRRQLPTTVAGLLAHVADHTQRHVGQAITTAKIVKSERR
jgi:uncharacterized damage-inducible protein DinB